LIKVGFEPLYLNVSGYATHINVRIFRTVNLSEIIKYNRLHYKTTGCIIGFGNRGY